MHRVRAYTFDFCNFYLSLIQQLVATAQAVMIYISLLIYTPCCSVDNQD